MQSIEDAKDENTERTKENARAMAILLWNSTWNQDDDDQAFAVAFAEEFAAQSIRWNSRNALDELLRVSTAIVNACHMAQECNKGAKNA